MRHKEEAGMNMNLKLTGLEPVEVASRDELLALQLERLKWSLKHAYGNIAHYRAKFDKAGVHPGDLKSLADLAKFPFTTKADLRENYPYGMFAVPMRDIVRVHAKAGVHPGDLKSLADLAKFPFTTKADLRENYPYGMFAVPMRDIVRVHASS